MNNESDMYTLEQFADLLSVSKDTLRRWDNSGKLKARRNGIHKKTRRKYSIF